MSLTLPSIRGTTGRFYTVKLLGPGDRGADIGCTIVPKPGERIDQAAAGVGIRISNPDTARTLVSDGTRWRQLTYSNPELFDVRDFGAKCDGRTDDTVAFQDAINALPTFKTDQTQRGGTIHVPPGECRIGGTGRCNGGTKHNRTCQDDGPCEGAGRCTALITNRKSMRLIGAGAQVTRLTVTSPNVDGIAIGRGTQASDADGQQTSIEHLSVIGPAGIGRDAGSRWGIYVSSNASKIRDVEVYQFGGHGIFLEPSLVSLNDCEFTHVVIALNGGSGIFVPAGRCNNAAGNHGAPCSGQAECPGGACRAGSATNANVFNLLSIVGNREWGLDLTGANHNQFYGLDLESNRLGAVRFNSSQGNFMVAYFEGDQNPTVKFESTNTLYNTVFTTTPNNLETISDSTQNSTNEIHVGGRWRTLNVGGSERGASANFRVNQQGNIDARGPNPLFWVDADNQPISLLVAAGHSGTGAARSIGLGDHQLRPVWKVRASPDASLNTGQVDFTISNAGTVYQTQKLDGSATEFPLGIVVNGTAITKHLSRTSQVNYGTTGAGSCEDSVPMIRLGGARDGDTVVVGIPAALASQTNAVFSGYVSGSDEVKVRRCNVGLTPLSGVPPTTVRIDVWQH